MSDTNPFSPPNASSGVEQAQDKASLSLTASCRRSFRIVARLVRVTSICCAIGALFSIMPALSGVFYLDDYRQWSWLHTVALFSGLKSPCYGMLSFFSWRYAASLDSIVVDGSTTLEQLGKQMVVFWLAVISYVFLIVAEFGLLIVVGASS